MLFKTGKFLGNGARIFIDCGFKPEVIIIKSDAAQIMGFYTSTMWSGRSNVLGASDSYANGIAVEESGFYVGSHAVVNSNGVDVHWIAFAKDDAENDFDDISWCGNATNGRTLSLPAGKTPVAALIKRDSSREAAMKVASNNVVFMGGGSPSNCITFTSPGVVTLTSANNVNEYDSAGGLGEGIDGVFWYGGTNSRAVTWTGDGVAGRVIDLGLDNASAVLIANPAIGTSSGLVTNTMAAGQAAPVGAAGLLSDKSTIVGSTLVIGSDATRFNNNGSVYGAVVFANKTGAVKSAPAIHIKNNQAVYLPAQGVASYIDCGTSDATLLIDGAISYEFCGAFYTNSVNVDSVLIARGPGAFGVVGGYSWSVLGCAANDGSLGWQSGTWAPQVGTKMAIAAPLDNANWRTGIRIPYGKIHHMVATVAADGTSLLYMNGELVKQSKNTVSMGIDSITAHQTVIGARVASGSPARNTRLLLKELAIYSKVLTPEEVSARFARSMQNSTLDADVTIGRAAYWNANNAGGTLLPDEVNSANNGTITLGNIVTL